MSLTWEPHGEEGHSGVHGCTEELIFVFKAVEATDALEQGKFRVRVLTKDPCGSCVWEGQGASQEWRWGKFGGCVRNKLGGAWAGREGRQ